MGVAFVHKLSFFSLFGSRMPSKKKKGQKTPEVKATYSVEELCSKAEDLIEQLHPELAEKFYLRALELEPENTHVLDDFATLLLEMDDFIRAKEVNVHSRFYLFHFHFILLTNKVTT